MKQSKQITEKYIQELINVLQIAAKDRELLREFLADLLTPREYEEIGVRWQIIKKLAKDEHHHAIADDLKIGVATVTRGARELLDTNGGFKKVLAKLKAK